MKSSVFLGLAAILVCATLPASATDVGGPILTDTTWNHHGSPYIVTTSIMVGNGATLVIEPDVEVRFGPGLALQVAGTLVARGTEELPILFTSNQPTPAPGDWSRIQFLDQAADAVFDESGNYQGGCILQHVIVEYAGAGEYGAVNVDRSAPYLSFSQIRHNLKSGVRAGPGPGLRIEHCNVHDNHDTGMYLHTGNNTVAGNTITANSATHGGAVSFWAGSQNLVTGNTISQNTASEYGGGLLFYASDGNRVTNNTITDNTGGYGGGLAVWLGGTSVIAGNTISGNTTTRTGGGVYTWDSEAYTFVANTIASNHSAVDGGGIMFTGSGRNVLVGNVFNNNSTDGRGGGINCTFTPHGTMKIVNSTFRGNSANLYGGAVAFGNGTVANCVFWGNSAPDGSQLAVAGYDVSTPGSLAVLYSDVQGGRAGVYVEPGSTLDWHEGNTDGGPLFVDPSNGDLRLGAGSPCIDAGDNTAVPRDTADLDGDGCWTDRTSLDFDGNYRFHDDPNTPDTGVGTYSYPGVVDMGAYEYGSDLIVPDGPCFGELNCDGAIDNFDINPFVMALTSQAAYQATYPDCNFLNADVNDDGVVDNFDINAFIALLVGT